MRRPDTLRTIPWVLALAALIALLGRMTLPWASGNSTHPLEPVLFLAGFLLGTGCVVVLSVRRRRLLEEHPALPLAALAVCVLSALSLWPPLLGEVLSEYGLYLLFVGPVHLGIFLLIALLLAPLAFVRSPARYGSLIERLALFSGLLLFVGALCNVAWMELVYRRFYFSQDTVVDFLPFLPFGQWVLEVEWAGQPGGLLNGAALWHLQALWLLFAVLAWGATALAYRRMTRQLAAGSK